MKIGNNPQHQLYDNTEEIELLKQEIAPWWKSTVALSDSDTSIAISSTNAPVDTQRGFLIDPNGKLFKITAGDGTTLLLEFYSKLTITQESGGDTPSGGSIVVKSEATIGYSDIISMMAGGTLTSENGNKFTLAISGSYGNSNAISMGNQSNNITSTSPSVINNLSYGSVILGKRNDGSVGFGSNVAFTKFVDPNGNIKYGLKSVYQSSNPQLDITFYQLMRNNTGDVLSGYNMYRIVLDIIYFDISSNEYKTMNNFEAQIYSSGGSTVAVGYYAGFSVTVRLTPNMILLGLNVKDITLFKSNAANFTVPDGVLLNLEYPYPTE